MAGTLSTLSTVFFICAALLFVLSVIIFFALNIPSVIGYLNGKNVRKSISEMRLINEKTGAKSYDIGKINYERGKITSQIKPDTHRSAEKTPLENGSNGFSESPDLPEKIYYKSEAGESSYESDGYGSGSTELLDESDGYGSGSTELLDESYGYEAGPTELLDESDSYESEQTGLLSTSEPPSLETELLDEQYQYQPAASSVKKNIELIEEVILIHTNEVI